MQAEFIHNYIFDFDGTLIDPSNQVLFYLEYALVFAGFLVYKFLSHTVLWVNEFKKLNCLKCG